MTHTLLCLDATAHTYRVQTGKKTLSTTKIMRILRHYPFFIDEINRVISSGVVADLPPNTSARDIAESVERLFDEKCTYAHIFYISANTPGSSESSEPSLVEIDVTEYTPERVRQGLLL